ncbi:MAG: hypothetical protein ABI361_11125 [Nitrososphaera sp.]|jgi:hypothetical protein
MNLTRPDDSTNMKWITYNITGFDSQGNCNMLEDRYYIPQFGIIQSNFVCSLPKDRLNPENVTAFIRPGGAISADCHPLHLLGLPIPQAGLTHVYNLTIANQTYPIRYGFLDNGTIENMTANTSTKTVTVTIKDYYDNSSDQERLFSVEFPRAIFNANHSATNQIGCSESGDSSVAWQAGGDDIQFITNITNNPAFVHHIGSETCGRYTRVVSFDYPSGVSTIQIIGTNMVPEFGISIVVMAIAIVGVFAVISHRQHNSFT